MKPNMVVEFYKDKKGEWRWRVVAKNGKIVADSGEGYKRPSAAKSAWSRFENAVFEGWFEEK